MKNIKSHKLSKSLLLATILFLLVLNFTGCSNSMEALPDDIHKSFVPSLIKFPRGIESTSELFLHPDVEQKESIYRLWTLDSSPVSHPKFSISAKDYNKFRLATRHFNSHSFVNPPMREIYLSDEDAHLYTSKIADQSEIMCISGWVETCNWWAYRGRYSQYVVSVKLYYSSQEYTAEEFYSLIAQIDAHIAQQLQELQEIE